MTEMSICGCFVCPALAARRVDCCPNAVMEAPEFELASAVDGWATRFRHVISPPTTSAFQMGGEEEDEEEAEREEEEEEEDEEEEEAEREEEEQDGNECEDDEKADIPAPPLCCKHCCVFVCSEERERAESL